MARAFGLGPPALRWVIICYVLTYAVTSFVGGVVADRLGPARVFTAGLWLATVVLLAYGLALSYGTVLLLRVAQGIGGGLVYGTAPALVTLALPRDRHGWGLGLMTLGLAAGQTAGPLIGGALVQAFGWTAVFLFRAPILAVLALLASRTLGPARARWSTGRLILPPGLGEPRVLTAALLAFLSSYAQFAVWLLAPFLLLAALGVSPGAGGLVLMLMPLASAVAAPAAGRVTDRLGARGPLLLGLLVESGGLLLLGALTGGSPLSVVGLALALIGLGAGLFQVSNLTRLMTAFPGARQGAAGGLAFLSSTLGSASGVHVTAMVFEARTAVKGF